MSEGPAPLTSGSTLNVPPQQTSDPKPNIVDAEQGTIPRDVLKSALVDYFGKYNPDRVSSVDTLLDYYAGREMEFFSQLETKYGAAPQLPTAAAAATPAPLRSRRPSMNGGQPSAIPRDVLKATLVPYYLKHNPERLDNIDTLVGFYSGREQEYFKQLEQKYGEAPQLPREYASSVQGQQQAPSGLPQQGGAASSALPPPSPAPDTPTPRSTYKTVLEDYYRKHNPERVGDIDRILDHYKGRESTYFDELEKKYGVRPHIPADAPPPAASTNSFPVDASLDHNPATEEVYRTMPSSSDAVVSLGSPAGQLRPATREDYRVAVRAFYAQHNPEKVDQVERLLDNYKGNEKKFFGDLRNRYNVGPVLPPGVVHQCDMPTQPVGVIVADHTTNSVAPSSASAQHATAVDTTSPAYQRHRDRLTRFYQQYKPQLVSSVDENLTPYFMGNNVEALFAALVSEHGPEPNDIERQHWRGRLTRFYERYNPDRLSSVEEILDRNYGFEGAVMRELVSRYGPEPQLDRSGPPPRPAPILVSDPSVLARSQKELSQKERDLTPASPVEATNGGDGLPLSPMFSVSTASPVLAPALNPSQNEPPPPSAPSLPPALDQTHPTQQNINKQPPRRGDNLPHCSQCVEDRFGRSQGSCACCGAHVDTRTGQPWALAEAASDDVLLALRAKRGDRRMSQDVEEDDVDMSPRHRLLGGRPVPSNQSRRKHLYDPFGPPPQPWSSVDSPRGGTSPHQARPARTRKQIFDDDDDMDIDIDDSYYPTSTSAPARRNKLISRRGRRPYDDMDNVDDENDGGGDVPYQWASVDSPTRRAAPRPERQQGQERPRQTRDIDDVLDHDYENGLARTPTQRSGGRADWFQPGRGSERAEQPQPFIGSGWRQAELHPPHNHSNIINNMLVTPAGTDVRPCRRCGKSFSPSASRGRRQLLQDHHTHTPSSVGVPLSLSFSSSHRH
eukprot:PhM_4_TR4118/c0_g1_i1/m.66260